MRGHAPRALVPVVFCDHDGFASGVSDGEPSVEWPAEVLANESWAEPIRDGGPPLYGVGIRVLQST